MKDLFKLLTKEIKFEEALDYFKGKIPLKASEFYKLADEYRALAFTVSGYTKAQVLNKFYEELLKAIEEGTTMKEFKDNMNEFLEKKGYEGITNYQADNIFRTNIQTAYQVGHYKQMTSPEVIKYRPYWQYDAVNDRHTRPSHLAMDGKVFRADDPIWDIWYPPNGFRCRCSVKTLSERQVRERGLKVETGAPRAAEVDGRFVNILPDPNFSNNPAKNQFKPDMKDYPEVIKKAFERRESSKSK
jgi:SPP1 gp7 family putative phage head morphogenesis protein